MSDLELIKDTELPCPGTTTLEVLADEDTRRIYERQQADDAHKMAQEHIKARQQDRVLRGGYADKIYWLVCCWLAGMFVILLCCGLRWLELSDSVLIAIMTGTTIDILGLMVIVANYLFPKSGKK